MAKKYTRANCDYSFNRLKIIPALHDTITLNLISKYFQKCWDYHHACMEGTTAVEAINEAKKYTSHRRVPLGTNLNSS